MSSQPKTRALRKYLAEWYGAGDYNAAKATLRERIADGTFISVLAREVEQRAEAEGLIGKIAVSRAVLSKLLNETEEDAALVREARAEGGHAVAERAVQVAEDTPPDRDAVAAARLKVDTLRWVAGKLNKEYDDKPNPVQVNVAGQQFLQAVAKPSALRPAPPKVPAIDAEVVDELPATVPKAPKLIAEIERDGTRKRQSTG